MASASKRMRWVALLVTAFSAAPLAHGIRLGIPTLRDLKAGNGRVSFVQPDGTGTLLDLASGRVLARGVAESGRLEQPATPCGAPRTGPQPCAGGTLELSEAPEGLLLEFRSPNARWDAMRPRLSFGESFTWEGGGRLFIESRSWEVSLLECIDLATGEGVWAYAYPSVLGWGAFATETARRGRDVLDRFEGVVRAGGFTGTLPVSGEARAVRVRSQVAFDPDPMAASSVERLVTGAWTGLALMLGLLVALHRRVVRVSEHARSWLGLAVCAALGVGLSSCVLLDRRLLAAGVGTFLVGSVWFRSSLPREHGAARVALSLVTLAGLLGVAAPFFILATIR